MNKFIAQDYFMDLPSKTTEPENLECSGNTYHVKSVRWKGHIKHLTLEPSSLSLDVPLSACVAKGDQVSLKAGDAWVIGKNGNCQFLQPYVVPDIIKLGGIKREVLVKEITEEDEHLAYKALADYHYRGKSIHGRTARLIIRTFHSNYPKVIGYIELATPFFMNKPRALILDAPFSCENISWERWDMNTLRKYVHVIVRIARTVVAPEFRGADIGQILVRHAIAFARSRWQVSGYRPYFLEISADMLKFVPFVERVGMRYVGETEGNLTRVAKDMRYLINRFGKNSTGKREFEEISGILDQQIARMDRSLELMKRENIDIEDFLEKLEHLSEKKVLRDFALFQGIVSLPKPHYMLGLSSESSKFLDKRIKELRICNGHTPPKLPVSGISTPIILDNLTIEYASKVRRTYRTHAVQQAFDISPQNVRVTVLRNLNLTIEPGQVVLILGPSGSGKTSLLHLFDDDKKATSMHVKGEVKFPSNLDIAVFKKIRSRKPLIELIGGKDVRSALYLLGIAGLSEPTLYLKRFEELSKGQQYRAMLSKLIASEANVWIADEFCANLDSATANIVSDNIQRLARKIGTTVLVAASHCDHFLHSLRPDLVILLSTNWEHSILSGKDYIKAVSHPAESRGKIPRMQVSTGFLNALKKGTKEAIIRRGRRLINSELLLLSDDHASIAVRITSSDCKQFSDLSDKDAQAKGLESVIELKKILQCTYPELCAKSLVTVTRFEGLSKTSISKNWNLDT